MTDHLNGGNWTLIREVVEVESGANDERPKLAEALALCRLHGATLLIAKLDRLSRDVHFLTGLQKAGVKFVAADMPEANEMVVQMMAVVAQAERKMISARTKAALHEKKLWYAELDEAAKAKLIAAGRATKLGGHRGGTVVPHATKRGLAVRQAKAAARGADLAPTLAELRAAGIESATGLAKALTERGIPTARGSTRWSAVQVQRVLATIGG